MSLVILKRHAHYQIMAAIRTNPKYVKQLVYHPIAYHYAQHPLYYRGTVIAIEDSFGGPGQLFCTIRTCRGLITPMKNIENVVFLTDEEEIKRLDAREQKCKHIERGEGATAACHAMIELDKSEGLV